MNRGYFKWIVLLAVASVAIVSAYMWHKTVTESSSSAAATPLRPAIRFHSYIAAVGVVEASGGNISIGSPLNRLVSKIEVTVGQQVTEGAVLFRLDSQDLQADLISRSLEYEKAQASLNKLKALPRAEDLNLAIAKWKSAAVALEQANSQYQRVDGLQQSGAMSAEEVARRRYLFEESQANLQQAQAELDKVKAGAWPPEVEIARLQVEQTKALVDRVEADIARTIIRSPSAATVLQIKIHEGEFPPLDSTHTPAMIIGNTDPLSLRVSINQFDASSYNPAASAEAFLQGTAQNAFPLQFVRLEPYFITKQNLTNDITEKVDTRVLQAIYRFAEGENRVYVGQQMDVFIDKSF